MVEPISTATAKTHLRVQVSTEDDLIDSYIAAAREYIENVTGCILVQREIVEQRDEFGCYLELHRRPVVSIDEVVYIDTAGAPQVYADFVGQASRDPARVYPALGGQFPSLHDYGGVTVTYTAGYEAGEEPKALLQAMLLLIGHFYQNREAVTLGEVSQEVRLAVQSLCAAYWRPVI